MPVHNSDVASILGKVADLLEIRDKNQFRVRAYREAAYDEEKFTDFLRKRGAEAYETRV